jgi:hypothetical protein
VTDEQKQANADMLNSLWNMGETAFDEMLKPLTEMVERAETDECPSCFGFGEYITGISDSDHGEVMTCDCGGKA